jgi:hypothetical protein
VTGLQAALDAKAPVIHTHVLADLNIGGTPDGTKFLRDDGTWAALDANLEFACRATCCYSPAGLSAMGLALARSHRRGQSSEAEHKAAVRPVLTR